MEDVGLGDRHRYVTIGMRRTVIFEVERGSIEVQGLLRREGFGRNGRQRRRREVEIPVLDSLGDQQMLVGVLMGDDGRPFRIQPLVAVRVIECQCVLIRCLTGSRLRPLAASRMRGRDTVIPASMNTLPSAPVSTAMLPPGPSRMLTLPRTLWTLMGALAASSRIRSTTLRASAKACRGESHSPVAATVVAAMQHRQNPRRDMMC